MHWIMPFLWNNRDSIVSSVISNIKTANKCRSTIQPLFCLSFFCTLEWLSRKSKLNRINHTRLTYFLSVFSVMSYEPMSETFWDGHADDRCMLIKFEYSGAIILHIILFACTVFIYIRSKTQEKRKETSAF